MKREEAYSKMPGIEPAPILDSNVDKCKSFFSH